MPEQLETTQPLETDALQPTAQQQSAPGFDQFGNFIGEKPEAPTVAKKPTPVAVELTEGSARRLAEAQRRLQDVGILPTDDMDADTWAYYRNLQVSSGKPSSLGTEPAVTAEVPTSEATEQEAGLFGLPADHPLFEKQRAVLEYYGQEHLLELVAPVREAQVDVIPGLVPIIADLDNSVEVALLLAQNPGKVLELNNQSPAKAKQTLLKMSKELTDEPQPKLVTKAPPPPQPVHGRASGAFDVNDENMNNEEWARRRNEQLRHRNL